MKTTSHRTLIRGEFKCSLCGRLHLPEVSAYCCHDCGGPLELNEPLAFDQQAIDYQERGLWRYRHMFSLDKVAKAITLGEGGTPLVEMQRSLLPSQPKVSSPDLIPDPLESRGLDLRLSEGEGNLERSAKVFFKLEYLNPTGSFKDRGTTLIMTALVAGGYLQAAEDSSGNAGASFAAYAARGGVQAQVFIPETASPIKIRQIEAYGSEVVYISGPRSKATEAIRQAISKERVYASHVYCPLSIEGLSTVAFEIWEQLGEAPDWIICPAGQGTFLLGLARGFRALQAAKLIKRFPHLVGVQALACAPMWAMHRYGTFSLTTEGPTSAEGIRISQPVHSQSVLKAIRQSQGGFIAVDELQIYDGQKRLARLGFYVEPTSAVVWQALLNILEKAKSNDTIVVILTGSGLKSPFPLL